MTKIKVYLGLIFKYMNEQTKSHSKTSAIWQEVAKQIAHEINTPLSSMKLNIQYLQRIAAREGKVSVSQMDNIGQSLIQQIDNLSEIAGVFRDYAQLPQGKMEPISLNKMAKNAFITFSDHHRIKLDLDLPHEEILIVGDENYILRALNNLLKNAIQAIPEDRQGVIRIALSKNEKGNEAIIKVIDNGKGIQDSEKAIIFKPHFTTKKSGTGLGLAIVKNIVTSMSGEISFHSSENRGTIFVMQFPLHGKSGI